MQGVKPFLISLFVISVFVSNAQKLKYNKDVYPLIKEGNYEKVLPILEEFLKTKPNHANANYWAGKIYEAKAYQEINFDFKFKAFDCYMNCSKNVQTFDLTIISAARYPDISGLNADERYASLIAFLNGKLSELNHFKEKVKKTTENFSFLSLKELESKFNINLPDSLSELSLINLTGRVDKTQLNEVTQYDGLLYIDAISETQKQRVEVYSEIEKNYFKKITDVKFHTVKVIDGGIEKSSIGYLESILNFKFSPYLSYSVSEDVKLKGNIQYSEINNTQYVNGNFHFKGENILLKGTIINGTGKIQGMWQDYETFSTNAFSLEIKDSQLQLFRYEVLYANSTPKFFEDKINPSKYNASNYHELEMENCTLVANEEPVMITLKLVGPYNNEDEGADVILDGYNFQSKEGQVLFFSQTEVSEELKSELNNTSNKGQWYIVTYTSLVPNANIFKDIDPIKNISSLEKTNIFNVKDFADKYNGSLSTSALSQVYSLAKKWLQSFKNGNYTLYKSITLSENRMSLDKFTKTTAGVKSVEFNKNTDYVIGKKGNNLFLTNVFTTYGKEIGTFEISKQNGVWKIKTYYKHSLSNEKITNKKAEYVISKSPPNLCDCVSETANGNKYIAKKCYFYYSSFYDDERRKVISQFISCLNDKNYCQYKNNSEEFKEYKLDNISLFYLMDEIHVPNEEERKKLNSLKLKCK